MIITFQEGENKARKCSCLIKANETINIAVVKLMGVKTYLENLISLGFYSCKVKSLGD